MIIIVIIITYASNKAMPLSVAFWLSDIFLALPGLSFHFLKNQSYQEKEVSSSLQAYITSTVSRWHAQIKVKVVSKQILCFYTQVFNVILTFNCFVNYSFTFLDLAREEMLLGNTCYVIQPG